MKKICIILIAALGGTLFTLPARAQRKIDPTVEVKKDFEGKLLEIHKTKLETSIPDSLNSFNLNFNYTIFNKPYKDMYEFNPLPSARIHSPVAERHPRFFARVGLGYPLNPNAEVYYQPDLNKKGGNLSVTRHSLLLKGYYNALWDKRGLVEMRPEGGDVYTLKKADEKATANHSVMGALAEYRHNWGGGELSTGVHFSSNYYTYYGLNKMYRSVQDSCSHTFNTLGVHFNIGSVNAKATGAKFNYKLNLLYRHTSDWISGAGFTPTQKGHFREDFVKAEGEFGPTFGRYNQFLVGVNSETVLYGGLASSNAGILEFIPQYKFEKGRFRLNAGVRISISYSNLEGTHKYHNVFSPQANVSYEVVPRNLWIYAVADGGNELNSYSTLLERNKWLVPMNVPKTGSVPFRLTGGFKGKVFDKLSYNVYVNYTRHSGLLQFINALTATQYFGTGYSNHNEFSAGGELNWQTKVFSAGAKIKYSSYSKGTEASGMPEGLLPSGYAPLEGYLYGEYNWRERIYFGANLYFRNAAPFHLNAPFIKETRMEGFANLGVHAKYVINTNFAVFIQGGNLLNADIQYHPYYLEKGINFGAGLTVKF